MPSNPCKPPGRDACCFTGHAAAVTIEGEGTSAFTTLAALSGTAVRQVDLRGATIDGHDAVGLRSPVRLEPLPMSGPGERWKVTYGTGDPLRIELDLETPPPEAGKGRSTNIQAAFDPAPGCAAASCTVTWKDRVKKVEVYRDAAGTVELTAGFPYTEPGRLLAVTLEGADGTLRCDREGRIQDERIRGVPLTWQSANDGTLKVLPLRLEGRALAVAVEGPPTAPQQEAPRAITLPSALLWGVLLAVLAAVALAARKLPVAAERKDRIRMLLVFAAPDGSEEVRRDAEDRALKQSIKLSDRRDQFDIDTLPAATIDDLRRALLRKPRDLVHFSGAAEAGGLCFEDEEGRKAVPDPRVLGEILRERGVETVVLNACYAAEAIERAPMGTAYTVAVDGPLDDEGAIEFSRGFYDALGAGDDVPGAVEEGKRCAALKKRPVKVELIVTRET